MNESNITTAIMRYLRTLPFLFCWKEHGGMYGTAGLPDIICCYRGGFLGFEVKTPSGKLSKLQELTIAKIKAAGGAAYVVTSAEEVRSIIQNYLTEECLMNTNCYAIDPEKGCLALSDNSGCGESCPFRKSKAEVVAARQSAEKRLANLPEEQQRAIADKYYMGRRSWLPRKN